MSSKRRRKMQISYKSQLFSINDTPDWIWRVSRRDRYKSPSKSVSSTRCRLSLARVFPRPARFQHRLLRAWLKGYSSVSPFEHRKCSSLITKCNTVVASSDAKKKRRERGRKRDSCRTLRNVRAGDACTRLAHFTATKHLLLVLLCVN